MVALEAANRGFDVVLVESGQERFDQEAQKLGDAEEWDPSLHPSMQLTTRRQMGGTSVIWGGKCVPYDEIDFDRRPFMGGIHWPIGYEQIKPYFQRACDWLACGRAVFDSTQIPQLTRSLVPGFADGDGPGINPRTLVAADELWP